MWVCIETQLPAAPGARLFVKSATGNKILLEIDKIFMSGWLVFNLRRTRRCWQNCSEDDSCLVISVERVKILVLSSNLPDNYTEIQKQNPKGKREKPNSVLIHLSDIGHYWNCHRFSWMLLHWVVHYCYPLVAAAAFLCRMHSEQPVSQVESWSWDQESCLRCYNLQTNAVVAAAVA